MFSLYAEYMHLYTITYRIYETLRYIANDLQLHAQLNLFHIILYTEYAILRTQRYNIHQNTPYIQYILLSQPIS